MNLATKFEETLNLLRLELKDAKPLEKSYIQALKHMYGSDFEPRDLYFNGTCLITTDIDDANFILSRASDCEVLFKLESEHFGIGYYFINFLKSKELNAVIGGIA